MNQFNIGYQKGVQVGILAVYGDNDGFASTISGFNGSSDYNTLKTALANDYPSDASTSGIGQSALTQALKLVESPEFMGAGYRNTTQNHLIVYITTTSTPIPSSITQASTILSSGDYRIVAISYQGDGSNLNNLQQLVGNNAGCVLTSSNQGDYTGAFAQSFADKIFNANKNPHNDHIRQRSGVIDVTDYIYRAKHRWAGHVMRRTDDRWTRRITEWTIRDKTRPRGRPPARWNDSLLHLSLQPTTLPRTATTRPTRTPYIHWSTRAQDRKDWKQSDPRGNPAEAGSS
ncbi:hypothetical protein FO519_010051 [Halicephalobus sp. NKZ332]|nr:hypothetical protein FO519_010051 [Halicephalobus sp. NKZ332]